jgi:hypothetical protein
VAFVGLEFVRRLRLDVFKFPRLELCSYPHLLCNSLREKTRCLPEHKGESAHGIMAEHDQEAQPHTYGHPLGPWLPR